MPDREKVEKGLNICTSAEPCNGCPYLNERNCSLSMVADALAMLKEQEEQKRKWLQNIADNQLANAPMDGCCLEQWNYQKGVYDGLQVAYDILTEGR